MTDKLVYSDMEMQIAPSGRSRCAICQTKIIKGEARIHLRISNYHCSCFIKVIVSVPDVREMVQDAITELTIERMEGK